MLTLAIVLVGKPLAAVVVVMVLRYPPRMAVSVALALAQIGLSPGRAAGAKNPRR